MKMSGIITPMVTPFRQNGEIDYEATAKLLDYLKEIEKIIGDSFRSLPRDPDYVHFELSRYMKTILFNIQLY